MRKSLPHEGKASGNESKFESYKEAWARIALAQESGFYLEAVVIEESVISDRLISYLTRPEAPRPIRKDSKGRWPSFAELISALRKEANQPGAREKSANLCEQLDKWRDARNKAVHRLVASDPGTPTIPVDEFLCEAKLAAATGEDLARSVLLWHVANRQNRQ